MMFALLASSSRPRIAGVALPLMVDPNFGFDGHAWTQAVVRVFPLI
jgi:hypothetical protein